MDKVIIKDLKNEPNEYENRKGFHSWHSHKRYTSNNFAISITDSSGGCGMQQLYNWYNKSNASVEDIKEVMEVLFKDMEKDVSNIICQIGENYYNCNFIKVIEELGFKVISEFKNLRHGNNYTQRLYSFIPEKAKLNEEN